MLLARRHSRRRAFTIVELLAAIVVMGILIGVVSMKYKQHAERMKVSRAILELQSLVLTLSTMDPRPTSLAEIGKSGMLDPWGQPYRYLKFDFSGGGDPPGARRDGKLRPINSDFDLYSIGKDGETNLSLTNGKSLDDIVVAHDGKWIGLAKDY